MPRATFLSEVRRQQESMGIRRAGQVYVDDQRENWRAYSEIITRMADTYRTSRVSTQIRLRELRLVVDHRTVVGQQAITGPVALSAILRQLVSAWPEATGDDATNA
jgi:hypothetical protein